MGFFDAIVSQVEGAISDAIQESHPGMMDEVTSLLGGETSLSSLVESFKENGLGEAVASWIGNGQNLPVTAEQIRSVLGSEQVQSIAEKLGISTDDVAEKLSALLPQVIDRLTPDGELPEGNLVENLLEGLLASKS